MNSDEGINFQDGRVMVVELFFGLRSFLVTPNITRTFNYY